ncbi:hypothetical protein SODG_001061 [Sodalis praecaptivus]|nr:hypothetical protein NVIRENTERO_00704 [Sodalis praecaptivus]
MRRILICLGIIAVVTSLSGCPWWGPHGGPGGGHMSGGGGPGGGGPGV